MGKKYKVDHGELARLAGKIGADTPKKSKNSDYKGENCSWGWGMVLIFIVGAIIMGLFT